MSKRYLIIAVMVAVAVIMGAALITMRPVEECGDNCTVTYTDPVILNNATRNATAQPVKKPVTVKILFVYQDDCPYCLEMEPVIQRIDEKYNVTWINLTSDSRGPALVKQYDIKSVPAVVFIGSKTVVLREVATYGMVLEDIKQVGG